MVSNGTISSTLIIKCEKSRILLYFINFFIRYLKDNYKLKKLNHLSEISNFYDAYIIDLWGVMHNGIELNQSAIKVTENLLKK